MAVSKTVGCRFESYLVRQIKCPSSGYIVSLVDGQPGMLEAAGSNPATLTKDILVVGVGEWLIRWIANPEKHLRFDSGHRLQVS